MSGYTINIHINRKFKNVAERANDSKTTWSNDHTLYTENILKSKITFEIY